MCNKKDDKSYLYRDIRKQVKEVNFAFVIFRKYIMCEIGQCSIDYV